jgi:hypothetical protein
MDRELRVLKDGYLFAEMVFNYETQTSGKVNITMYIAVDVTEDIKSVYPVSQYETNVSHPALYSVEEIKAFDLAFLKEQPDTASQLNDSLEFLYEPVKYRYVVGKPVVGIADIHANFSENKKELRFISATHIKEDHSLAGDSIECNVDLLKRSFEHTTYSPSDFTLIGWD